MLGRCAEGGLQAEESLGDDATEQIASIQGCQAKFRPRARFLSLRRDGPTSTRGKDSFVANLRSPVSVPGQARDCVQACGMCNGDFTLGCRFSSVWLGRHPFRGQSTAEVSTEYPRQIVCMEITTRLIACAFKCKTSWTHCCRPALLLEFSRAHDGLQI